MTSLAARFLSSPSLTSPEAERRVTELIEKEAALAPILEAHPRSKTLLAAAFAGSPYLRHLCEIDPLRLARLLDADPDEHFQDIVRRTAAACAAPDEAALMRVLRRLKQETALSIALADLGGAWSLEQVTRSLTAFADAALSASVDFLLRQAAARGKLTPKNPDDPAESCGYVILAMGKHGSGELNYSSDIDLIVLHDGATAPLTADVDPSSFFVRLTKSVVRLLQDRTEDGYVFRVDLRLRPDPASTTVSIDLESALNYYERIGQNWERAALIKARPVAGDLALGRTALAQLKPFVFRKYFDFAAIADVHAMKRQVHLHRGHGAVAIEGHNVKLGRGGIREIEFFVQTQQLIAGGRDPSLRGRETILMLSALAAAGWVEERTRDDLAAAYRFLRTLEHRLQMVADEQTHTLPKSAPEMDRIARLMGFAERDSFAEAFQIHLRCVEGHYARLFETAPAASICEGLVFAGPPDDPKTLAALTHLGFSSPAKVCAMIRDWLSGRLPATRSEKARESLTTLAPALIEAFARSADPDSALAAFDRFLSRPPSGVQLLSLLNSNPQLVTLLTDALETAPRLSERIVRRPHALDALLEPDFFDRLPSRSELDERFAFAFGEARSYEDALDRARILVDEQKTLIGMRILSGTLGAAQAGRAHAALADAAVFALHGIAQEEFAKSHGRPPGGGTAILALGKLGGEEMTAASDLDLIVLYDSDDPLALSDGPKPLQTQHYYARFAQRLVAALSAPTAEGRAYDVDLRLRPSGRAGPLATSLSSFEHYQRDEAWTWERMALTRARIVSGDPVPSARAAGIIRAALLHPRDPDQIRADAREMRARVAKEKGEPDAWDLKLAPGGLLDLEFLAQVLQLVHARERPDMLSPNTEEALIRAVEAGFLQAGDAEILISSCRLHHALTQILRLCLDGSFTLEKAPMRIKTLLAQAAALPDFVTLDSHIRDAQRQTRMIFEKTV